MLGIILVRQRALTIQFLFSNKGPSCIRSPHLYHHPLTLLDPLHYCIILYLYIDYFYRTRLYRSLRSRYNTRHHSCINTYKETFTLTLFLDGLTPTIEVMACAINDKPLRHARHGQFYLPKKIRHILTALYLSHVLENNNFFYPIARQKIF